MKFRIFIFWLIIIQLLGFFLLFIVRLFSQSTLIIDQMLIVSGVLAFFSYATTNPDLRFLRNLKFPDFQSSHNRSKGIARISVAGFAALLFLTISVQTVGNIDRSRSMFMFEWIGCAPNSIQLFGIENRIVEKFGTESLLAFQQRVEEQKTRGFIDGDGSSLDLTNSGVVLFHFQKTIQSVYKLTGWKKNLLWNVQGCSY
jgi:hypothetical protein